ncbi:MAG: HD domain-containing protein [Magnetospiraceae bacterium]
MWTPSRYIAALQFAATAHAGQKVPGSDLPYLVHVTTVCMEVAGVVAAGEAIDADLALQCALLHDTVEDTSVTLEALAALFGPGVAAGVAALSKDSSLPKEDRMVDSLRRIQAQPREIWMVKLADRITNLQPPPKHWPAAKCRAYQAEAREIHAALGGASPHLSNRLTQMITAYDGHIPQES